MCGLFFSCLNNAQVLLFSATFSDTVKDFASKIFNDLFVQGYNRVFVEKEKLPLRSVNQYKVNVPDELAKIMVIKDKLMELADGVCQTVIFVRTRVSAGMLHAALVNYGYAVTTVHGALTEQDRDKIIQEFRDGLTQVLIATDIIARGFDQFKVCIPAFLIFLLFIVYYLLLQSKSCF